MASTARGRRYVLAAAVLWSLSGAITKSLALDPLTIAFYRGLFAGLALLPFVSRGSHVFRPMMIPLGLVFGAMTGLFLGSMKLTTAANTIYLQYTATFWVVPFGLIFLGERPDRRALVGIFVAMIGIAIIVGFGHSGTAREWRGVLMGLASGVAYALVVIGMRRFRGLDPIWLSAVNNLGGAMSLGAWMVLTQGPPSIPSMGQGAVLVVFGVVQMAIPYTLFARGLREIDAAEAGLICLAEPILNPVWVVLVAHEWPSLATAEGGTLLLAGVAFRYLKFSERGAEPRPGWEKVATPEPELGD